MTISSNKNSGYMVFTKLSNAQPIMYGNSKTNFAVKITNVGRIIISGLHISGFTNGIILSGISTNNQIINNVMSSNYAYGIYFNSSGNINNNFIFSNTFNNYGTGGTGIFLALGNNNFIRNNSIQKYQYGITLTGTCTNNRIVNNVINSNFLIGIYLNSGYINNNFILSNTFFGSIGNGIEIFNGNYNFIQNNSLHKFNTGIYINNSSPGSSNNYISRNNFATNSFYDIYVSGFGCGNTYIVTNKMNNGGNGSHCSIYIDTSYGTMIKSNQIVGINGTGVYLSTAQSNFLLNNIISTTNNTYGIELQNCYNNKIMSNNLFGNKQLVGIYLWTADNNAIKYNKIHNNKENGIQLFSSANYNYLDNNLVYSNLGPNILSTSSFSNIFISNIIWGPNSTVGIELTGGIANKVYRNLIFNNVTNIIITGNETGNKIVNNTIGKSTSGSGILWSGTASGNMYNNIILSNTQYGINRTSSGTVFVGYNDIYGNTPAATNGGITWGNGNTLINPLLNTVTSWTISSVSSPAIDSGTNYWVSLGYNGNGWDMGYRISFFCCALHHHYKNSPFY